MKNLFHELWEKKMSDKVIPVQKKAEMKRIAWEWFSHGINHRDSVDCAKSSHHNPHAENKSLSHS